MFRSIHNVKSLFDAFSIDFLITTAFGVVIDSLNDPAHPIIVNGQKLITFQMGLLDFAKMGLISVAPRLSKTLGIELMSEYTSFFTKLSQNIMEQKRAEFKKTKNYAKANSFIEFMLEAEEASLSNDENKNNEKAKQSNKCKCSFVPGIFSKLQFLFFRHQHRRDDCPVCHFSPCRL